MKAVTVALPDGIYEYVRVAAEREGLEVSAFCSGLLTEHLSSTQSEDRRGAISCIRPSGVAAVRRENGKLPNSPSAPNGDAGFAATFSVADHFPGFPHRSIQLAQRVVDELCQFGAKFRLRENGRGIEVSPNFCWIEYLLSQGGRGGVAVSLFGGRDSLGAPQGFLLRGRTDSYSRKLIETESDLRQFLPLIRRAHQKKFGADRD